MRLALAALVLAAPAALGAPVTKAVAVLQPTKDSAVRGSVSFSRVAEGVRVVARVEGLTPGLHGFHVHEFGDCSAADFTSAGGHFNPMAQPHAGPDAAARHVGDLGNVKAGDRVIFGGGFVGLVANIKEHTLLIKVADNTKVEVLKAAVTRVLQKDEELGKDSKE